MSSPTKDHDLLARLNALKQTSIILENTPSVNQAQGDDLTARFLRFTMAGKSRKPKIEAGGADSDNARTGNPEDDQTLEDLLAEVGPEDQWILDPEEPKDIEKLMKEAKASLEDGESKDPTKDVSDNEDELTSASKASNDLSSEAQTEAAAALAYANDLKNDLAGPDADENDEAQATSEEQEADLALQKILDELSLENALVDPELVSKDEISAAISSPIEAKMSKPNERETTLELPSTPDAAPVSRVSSSQAQPGGLDLPSAPSTKPGKNIPKSNLPTYTDEQIDTWCVICNDDATIRCKGCDGDLYCAKCWREGHTGPDVGFEERTHRWTKYTRPR